MSKTPPRIVSLSTPYTPTSTPYDVYPRPQMMRDDWTSLNGEWCFVVQRNGKNVYNGSILVPFPPESAISGVGRVTKLGETLIYTKTFSHQKTNHTTLLHFGAVDCLCEVYVNEILVAYHEGGYLPFSVDITSQLKEGENTLCVKVWDDTAKTFPYGKQKHKRGGMWYTPTSGIWQTVWLEKVPAPYIKQLTITPTLTSVTIKVNGGVDEKSIILDGNIYQFTGESVTIPIHSPRLWTPEDPYLYHFTLSCGEDMVASYFALREIGVKEVNGKSVLTLNQKPYFFHGLLDQGYYADGLFLPGSPKGFEDDILRMKCLGFNMLRKHIKVEPDIFYYYCDKYGMAVFQDMVNAGSYSFLLDTAIPTVLSKRIGKRPRTAKTKRNFLANAKGTIEHLYNHPSVIYYTIYNEGWGQPTNKTAKAVYEALKCQDPTRIYDTASGWFVGVPSDVESKHVYFKPVKLTAKKGKPMVLSEFGGYSCKLMEHAFNLDKTYGYKTCPTPESFTHDLETLYQTEIITAIKEAGLCAAVLTQVSDVEDETNGLLTYDRQVIKVDEAIMQEVAFALQSAFSETFSDSPAQ